MPCQISVVIPSYNRNGLLQAAVESVLRQDGQGGKFEIKEILIIDDGSTDGTEEAMQDYDANRPIKKPVIRFLRLEKNGGAANARNVGVRMALGDWIAFQDSDDIWDEGKLEKQSVCLLQNPRYGMVYCGICENFPDGRKLTREEYHEGALFRQLATHNFIDTPSMLIRKDAFLSAGAFDTAFTALEDWEFAFRFSLKYQIGCAHEILLQSSMLPSGLSSDIAKFYDNRCRMIAKHKETLLKNGCFQDATASLLNHAAERGIARQVGTLLEQHLLSTLA